MHKLIFFIKKPKVVIVAGNSSKIAKEAIFSVLGKEVNLYDNNNRDSEFFLKKSQLPILIATHIGEYHPEKEFFAGDIDKVKRIKNFTRLLPSHGYLILNFDDETVRDLKNESKAHPITFGFGARADVRASDVVLTQSPDMGTNFKINYDGNIVPCWLGNLFGKENIYAALSAAATGLSLGFNLVQISEALKNFKGISGRMQLISGIKNSLVLDDSESASPLSMLESLDVLKKIEGTRRKIAVLGDILSIGKYSIEAHEALGQEIKGSADLLFTVGERAKFLAEGAKIKGMEEDKIFQFDDAISAAKALQSELKEGDLVLVDGSKEMNMMDIVKEVKPGPIV